MHRLRSLVVPALLLGSLSTSCFLPTVSATPRVAFMQLDGDVRLERTDSGVTTAGTATTEQLGLGDDDTVFNPRADVKWGGLQLTVSNLGVGFAGQGTLDSSIELPFGDFVVTGDVESRFELDITSAALTFDVVPTDIVDVGIGVGVAYTDIDAFIQEALTLETIETSETAPVPMVALRAAVDIGRVRLEGLGQALEIEIEGDDVALYDIDLAASVRLLNAAGFGAYLTGGYRMINAQANYDDDGTQVDLDIELSGPYIGATIMF